jgi:hypothetical protein
LGQQVFAQQWETPPTLPLQLSLQQFLASPYVLQLSDGKKTVSRLFVKE